jgi:hypothetical protein
MLSSEKYIRKKASSLSIHVCWITADWDTDEDAFKELNLDEKGNKFMQYVNCSGKLESKEYFDYLDLLQSIVDDLLDIEIYNRFYDELSDNLRSVKIEYDKIPNA